MANEFIISYKKPGFPVIEDTENATRTRIEYVGPKDVLDRWKPAIGDRWGDYTGIVRSVRTEIAPGTDNKTEVIGELYVTIEEFYSDTDGTQSGVLEEVRYEIDWLMFSRDIKEHPDFRLTGSGRYKLTSEDIVAIEAWQNESDKDKKKEYQYKTDFKKRDSEYATLSTNAQKLAIGLQIGQDSYEDFYPVIRKISTYTGGPPPGSDAGRKDNPPSTAGGPAGYQWRKSADRSMQTGVKKKWDRIEEWTGAITVLSDRDQIYW